MSSPPPDWVAPRIVCVIATSPRCGSNVLAALCRTTWSLGHCHEWFNFNPPWTDDFDQNRTVQQRCWLAVKKGTTSNGVTGMKMFLSQLANVEKEIDFLAWFPTCHWIWLRRRDLLRQSISLLIAKQGGAWTSWQQRRNPLIYDPLEIRMNMEIIVAEDTGWFDYFSAHGISPLVLWYEDIADQLSSAPQLIARYMSVDLKRQPDFDHAPQRKQATHINEEWFEHFIEEDGAREIVAALNAKRCVNSGE
jgi:trehalose 2-sulfotransferase